MDSLSPKQRAAIRRAPPAQKAALKKLYESQPRKGQGAGLMQGFYSPMKPAAKKAAMRGSGGGNTAPKKKPAARILPLQRIPRQIGCSWAFDGFDERHMPTDDVTAPYLVTNFISVLEFSSRTDKDAVVVVGPRGVSRGGSLTAVSDILGVVYNGASHTHAVPKNADGFNGVTVYLDGNTGTDGVDYIRSPVLGAPLPSNQSGTDTRGRLHNLTIKVECLGASNSMIPTGGIYIGAVPMLEGPNIASGTTGGVNTVDPPGSALLATIKQRWVEPNITTGYIKSVRAADLMYHPVCLSAAVNEHVEFRKWSDIVLIGSSQEPASLSFAAGLEDLVVYVPRTGDVHSRVFYRVSVGHQWCTRHPADPILRAAQRQYAPSSPAAFQSALKGVKNIGEVIAKKAPGVATEVATGLLVGAATAA